MKSGSQVPKTISKAIANQQKQVKSTGFSLPAPNLPVQLYAVHAADPDFGTTISSANNLYQLPAQNGNETIYANVAAPVPRYSKEISEFDINGFLTKEYEPSDDFVADCLHTAEEIMHNQRLAEGNLNSQATATGTVFGDTEQGNWDAANAVNPLARNQNAAPGVGNAYAIVSQHPINLGHNVICQYHAAAVVAVDGTDHITLEVFGQPNNGDHDAQGSYSIYDSAPGSGLTFHDGWINTFANGITISLSQH